MLGTQVGNASGSEREILEATANQLSLPRNKLSCDVIRAVILSLLSSDQKLTPEKVIRTICDHRKELRQLVDALIERKKRQRWLMIPILALSLPAVGIIGYKLIKALRHILSENQEAHRGLHQRLETVSAQVSAETQARADGDRALGHQVAGVQNTVATMDEQLDHMFNEAPVQAGAPSILSRLFGGTSGSSDDQAPAHPHTASARSHQTVHVSPAPSSHPSVALGSSSR